MDCMKTRRRRDLFDRGLSVAPYLGFLTSLAMLGPLSDLFVHVRPNIILGDQF